VNNTPKNKENNPNNPNPSFLTVTKMQHQNPIDAIGYDNLNRQDSRELRRDLDYENRRRQTELNPQSQITPFSSKCPPFYLSKLTTTATSLAKIHSSTKNLSTEKSNVAQHQLEGTIPPSLIQNQKLLDNVQNPQLRHQIAESLCADRIAVINAKLEKLETENVILLEEVTITYDALVPSIRASFSLAECKSFITHERDITISKFNLKRLENEKKKEIKRITFQEKKLKDEEVTMITKREHQDLRRLLSKPKPKPKPKPTSKSTPKSKSKNAQARPPLKKESTGRKSRDQAKGKQNINRS
jgi:hypothetical protein